MNGNFLHLFFKTNFLHLFVVCRSWSWISNKLAYISWLIWYVALIWETSSSIKQQGLGSVCLIHLQTIASWSLVPWLLSLFLKWNFPDEMLWDLDLKPSERTIKFSNFWFYTKINSNLLVWKNSLTTLSSFPGLVKLDCPLSGGRIIKVHVSLQRIIHVSVHVIHKAPGAQDTSSVFSLPISVPRNRKPNRRWNQPRPPESPLIRCRRRPRRSHRRWWTPHPPPLRRRLRGRGRSRRWWRRWSGTPPPSPRATRPSSPPSASPYRTYVLSLHRPNAASLRALLLSLHIPERDWWITMNLTAATRGNEGHLDVGGEHGVLGRRRRPPPGIWWGLETLGKSSLSRVFAMYWGFGGNFVFGLVQLNLW